MAGRSGPGGVLAFGEGRSGGAGGGLERNVPGHPGGGDPGTHPRASVGAHRRGGVASHGGGDVSHHPLQVANPGWNSAGDLDAERAAQTRQAIIRRLAETGDLLAAGHYPGSGFGRVEVDGDGYRFVPVAADEP